MTWLSAASILGGMNGLQQASAFVVQFRAVGDPLKGKVGGRVEHVESGSTANFESVYDLPELLLRMLDDARQQHES
jgi:hypothetical protein